MIRNLLWASSLVVALVMIPWGGSAQSQGAPVFHYTTQLPTGSCQGTPPIQINYFTGGAVLCANGTWTPLGGTGAGSGNISGTLTAGTLVDATGAQTIASSIGTDNGVTLTYPGTGGIVSPSFQFGASASGNYGLLSLSDNIGAYPSLQLFSTTAGGTTVDPTGVYSQNVEGVYMQTGNFLASGTVTLGLLQNGVSGQPINVIQNGGGALTLNVEGGLGVTTGMKGPVTAPTGSCTSNGLWEFSQDGHATFCSSGTWTTKI
jgi:hypothetical protein